MQGGFIPMPVTELLAIAADYAAAGQLAKAERVTRRILAAHPTQAQALHQLGLIAFRGGRTAEAAAHLRQAVAHGPGQTLYLRHLAEACRKLNRLDEALAAGRQAVALAPQDPLCFQTLATLHFYRLELDESITAARRALALKPDLPGAHQALAEALLLRGEMEEGWEEYEWRFRLPGAAPPMPKTGKPRWDGGTLAEGTLLLVADQGLGDAIQFMRYIPWAAARCRHLAIAARAELVPLLRQVAPAEAAIFQDWRDCPDVAAHATLSGLPRLHGTRLDTVPWGGPYLTAPTARRQHWADRLTALLPSGCLRVGLCWAGRRAHANDANRSIGLAELAALGRLERTVLVSLQKEEAAAQAASWSGPAPLVELGAALTGFDDTMAVLDQLDLLITVDTAVGHLAGAMGRPTWLLLPHVPDWRWLLARAETPWYPSHRLFRQAADGIWPPVVARVAAALGGMAVTRGTNVP